MFVIVIACSKEDDGKVFLCVIVFSVALYKGQDTLENKIFFP